MAEIEGVSREHVMPFAGSSDPLHRAVLAFTGPDKSFVVADPGYEAGERAAEFIGAKTVTVPLRKDCVARRPGHGRRPTPTPA